MIKKIVFASLIACNLHNNILAMNWFTNTIQSVGDFFKDEEDPTQATHDLAGQAAQMGTGTDNGGLPPVTNISSLTQLKPIPETENPTNSTTMGWFTSTIGNGFTTITQGVSSLLYEEEQGIENLSPSDVPFSSTTPAPSSPSTEPATTPSVSTQATGMPLGSTNTHTNNVVDEPVLQSTTQTVTTPAPNAPSSVPATTPNVSTQTGTSVGSEIGLGDLFGDNQTTPQTSVKPQEALSTTPTTPATPSTTNPAASTTPAASSPSPAQNQNNGKKKPVTTSLHTLALPQMLLTCMAETANFAVHKGNSNTSRTMQTRLVGDCCRVVGDLLALQQAGWFDKDAKIGVCQGQLGRYAITVLDLARTAHDGYSLVKKHKIEQRGDMDMREQMAYKILPALRALVTCLETYNYDTSNSDTKKQTQGWATLDDLKLSITLCEVALELPHKSKEAYAAYAAAGASLLGFIADAGLTEAA